ncbi:MAG: polyprenyl synthetase family protein [Bacteroidota bacterium]
MANRLKEIQAPVEAEMIAFENKFRQSMRTNVMLLDKIMNYIVKRKGKQMRPLFIFLSAGVNGGISESTYTGASMIELLHTASLVHDDVVDDAHYRRGFFSINALWKNKIAVLVGDFLLSKGLMLSLENKDFEFLHIVSNAMKEMSEGELLQMEKARKLDITEEVYYDIIKAKTASLIASCCEIGAFSSGENSEKVSLMKDFGLNVGMAFQIKDDLFDYGTYEVGKPTGIDIKEKKMTLPLLYALRQVSSGEKRSIIKKIKKSDKHTKYVGEVIQFVKSNGGMEYATTVMSNYHQKALDILTQFPDSVYKKSLQDLVQYTIDRTK